MNLPDLIELDLSDNLLTKLPKDMSKFQKLKSFDISNNPFKNVNNFFIKFEQVAASLLTLPKLIDLKINLTTQNEAYLILNNLTNLQFLNGKSTREDTHIVDIEDKEIESISLNNEITNFNTIFTKISDKLKQVNKEANKVFFEEFQDLLKNEINNINSIVDNTVPNYIYATNVLASKIKIFDYFNTKHCECQDTSNPDNSKLSKEIVENIVKSSEFLISNLLLKLGIIHKLYPKIDEKTDNLRKQLDEALKAAQVVDNQIDGFGDKMHQANRERDFIIKQHQEEKQIMQEKIERLEKENKIMTDKLLKNAKDIIQNNNISQRDYNNNYSNNYIQHKKDDSVIYNRDNNQNDMSMIKSKLNTTNTNFNPNGSKILSLKMMKEIIEEIYDSKVIFDKKCYENKQPRETMEQHMYTYLNHRYGLKNLIIEWATSIINGIKTYSQDDSDVSLFGKVNQILN
jgi:hypothetical protein